MTIDSSGNSGVDTRGRCVMLRANAIRPVSTLPAPASSPLAVADNESGLRARAATWLALGMFALPFVQTLEWDFERCAPLILVVPALWSGRRVLARAWARYERAPRWLRLVETFLCITLVLSFALHPRSAAGVTVMAWALLATGAVLAGQIAAEEPRLAHRWLVALAASVSLGTVVHWTRWKLGVDPMGAFYPHVRLMGLHALGGALAATVLVVFAASTTWRALWFVVGAIAWGGLLWSGSRTPVIGAIAGLGVLLLSADRSERKRFALASVLLPGAGLALSLALRLPQEHLGVAGALQRSLEAGSLQAFTSNRSVFWAQAWQRFLESPWLGHGPDAYRFFEPKLEGAQPHNALLQWLLDFGLFGALATAVLVAFALRRGWRGATYSSAHLGWAIIAVASLVAAQLDGFFYHQMAFATTALALGICALASPAPLAPAPTPRPAWGRVIATTLPIAALAFHAWLFHAVAIAPPPAPDSLVARAWRATPTTTFALERWIEAWSRPHPDAAVELARIAVRQSPNGDFFHVQLAGLLWQRGDREGARRELATALAIASPRMRPVIQQLQRQTEDTPRR